MRPTRKGRRRAVLVGVLVVVLTGVTGGVAQAVPEERWRGGQFLAAGLPVYVRSVDGWGCHLFWACRDELRRPGDPEPAWYSQRRWERVMVECYLGVYVKVHQHGREGWTASSNIRTSLRVQPCTGFDF